MILVRELRDHPDTAARFAKALQLEQELDDLVASIARTAQLEAPQVMAAMIAARSEDAVDRVKPSWKVGV